MDLLHSTRVLIFRYCPPSVISPSLSPCLNHPCVCSSPVSISINAPSLWSALIGTYLCNCVIVSHCMKSATNWGLLSKLCFMREISNFLQPKLAQSSKMHVPSWCAPLALQGTISMRGPDNILLPSSTPAEWAASSCLCLYALPCCGLHITSAAPKEPSPTTHSLCATQASLPGHLEYLQWWERARHQLEFRALPCSPSHQGLSLPSKQKHCQSHRNPSHRNLMRSVTLPAPRTRDSAFRLCRKKHLTVWLVFSVLLWSTLQSPGPWPSTACFLPFQHYSTGCSITSCPPTQ